MTKERKCSTYRSGDPVQIIGTTSYFNKFPFFCIATFNAPRSAQNCSPVDMRGFMQDDVQH
jgi:hypothetical protein